MLHGLVGVVPLGNRQATYQLLLEANLFGRATDGAVLSIDFEQNEIILHRSLALRALSAEEWMGSATNWRIGLDPAVSVRI